MPSKNLVGIKSHNCRPRRHQITGYWCVDSDGVWIQKETNVSDSTHHTKDHYFCIDSGGLLQRRLELAALVRVSLYLSVGTGHQVPRGPCPWKKGLTHHTQEHEHEALTETVSRKVLNEVTTFSGLLRHDLLV